MSNKAKVIKLFRGKKAYSVFKCRECNCIISGVVAPNEELVCKKCNKKTRAPEELIKVEHKCSNCGTKGSMYTEKGLIDSTKCRNCQSPIDLFFLEKLGMYQSAGYRR